jgi:hypothetical protein
MSLAIKTENIAEILLPDGEWYVVVGDYGMCIDAYEYGFEDSDYDNKWFTEYQPDKVDGYNGFKARVKTYPPDTGNAGECVVREICGPMSSIVAIKLKKEK